MSIRLQRANFLVSDMAAALRFYVDVLGMEVAFKKEDRGTGYSHVVFGIEPGVKVDFVGLSTPTQPRVMALTQVPGLVSQPQPRRSAIVLDVEDVDGIVKRAEAGGFHMFEEEKLVTHDGRVGREIGILDDDGNLAVIYHITGWV